MDGIINICKEKGYTSHDVVAKLRGILHQKKIGHTGTLDPDAMGVLPVCLGKATKVCDLLTGWNKEYRATMLLGVKTDTQDMTGEVLGWHPVFLHESGVSGTENNMEAQYITVEAIQRCIESFIGEIRQTPPMYSALKVNGKKLYEMARQGIEVERKPRNIQIFDIRIETIHENMLSIPEETALKIPVIEVQMTVKCSKGTYIRTLCSDIGEKLGCGGTMSALLRTEVGPFILAEAWHLSDIEKLRNENRLEECLLPTDCVFAELKAVQLTPEAERLVRNGNPLSCQMISECREIDDMADRIDIQTGRSLSDQIRVYAQNREFLAVYEFHTERNSWRARKMFL